MGVRPIALFVLVSLLAVGCAGSSDENAGEPSSAAPSQRVAERTLDEFASKPGPEVAVTPGTADLATGPVRFTFLVLDSRGRPIERPRAKVWLAQALDERPFLTTSARLEPVGVPGGYTDDGGIKGLYVAKATLERPGTYWLLAEPLGGRPVQAYGNLVVKDESQSPAVGDKAYPSRTPTIGEAPIAQLTTRVPPDRELLRHSVADALRDKSPFVVAFATPKLCASRACGPVVDVVDTVRRAFRSTDVRFIHVEIFEENNPALGYNRWVREWALPSEPWVFLVGRDGRIKAKFEGAVSVGELQAAVRRTLLD